MDGLASGETRRGGGAGRAALALALGASAAISGCGPPPAPAPADEAPARGCSVLEAEMPRRDSMVVRLPRPRCGPLRLVVAGRLRSGRAEVYGADRDAHYPERWLPWALPVALVNEGEDPVPMPVELRVDSVSPVFRGTRVGDAFRRAFVRYPTVEPQGVRPRWRFTAPGDTARPLAPGERTVVRRLYLTTRWFTRRFRIALGTRDLPVREAPRSPGTSTRVRVPPDVASLGPVPERLLARADPPGPLTRRIWVRRPEDGIRVFGVAYGEAPRCDCAASSAVGLQIDDEAGWIAIRDYERDSAHVARMERDRLELDRRQARRFSPSLVDGLRERFGVHGSRVVHPLLRLVLGSPHARRDLLVHLSRSLYARIQQPLAGMLARSPAARSDPYVLTLLGDLPPGGPPYEGARQAARRRLRELGPRLAGDPETPRTTLFLVAQTLRTRASDTALVRRLASHPEVRDDPAILTVLEEDLHELRPRVIAAVDAPGWAREVLAEHLAGRHYPQEFRGVSGDTLLRAPDTRSNRDVLSVLANRQVHGVGRDVVWEASRRLPREALRQWEPRFVPAADLPGR